MRIVLFIFVFNFSIVNAQEIDMKGHLRDSLNLKLAKDSAHIFRKTLAKPYFKFENSISLANTDQIDLYGFLFGATLKQRHAISVGYYFLDPSTGNLISGKDNVVEAHQYTRLSYFAFGYHYMVFNSRYFHLNLPFTAGFGQANVDITTEGSDRVITENGYIIPANMGVQFVLKPVIWAGVTATIGYRNVFSEYSTGQVLRGPYYSLGIFMDARHVNRKIRYLRKKKIYQREMSKL